MHLPEGTRLAYVVRTEAWYRQDVARPGIKVMASRAVGPPVWEFAVEETGHAPGNGGLLLRMFDGSWDALVDVPEFFRGLPTSKSLGDVRALLDLLGAHDETPRDKPTA